jgi:hypothetical protein
MPGIAASFFSYSLEMHCRFHAQRLDKKVFILRINRLNVRLSAIGHKFSHQPGVGRAVGKHEELVPGVEIDKVIHVPAKCQRLSPALQGEDLFDEGFPLNRIVEPLLFLDRQQGKVPGENPGEQAHSFLFRHALRVVDLDPHEAAVGRVAHEDKPAEVFRFKFPDTFLGPVQHAIGVVDVGAGGDETRVLLVTDQTQYLPGDGETGLYLWADRNEIQVFAQRVRKVTVVFVAAIKPDRLPEKAGADADPDLVFHEEERGVGIGTKHIDFVLVYQALSSIHNWGFRGSSKEMLSPHLQSALPSIRKSITSSSQPSCKI